MRTDVKVGLICVFLLLLAFVGYFAYSNNKAEKIKPGDLPSNVVPPITADSSVSPPSFAGPGVVITPPGATTTPAILSVPPSFAPTTEPALVATAPAPTTPGYTSSPGVTVVPPSLTPTSAPSLTADSTPRTSYGGTPLIVDTTPSTTTPPGLILETPSSSTPRTTLTLTSDPSTYTVKKGDLLTSIAKSHKTTVKAIIAANPGINPDKLAVNQKIKLPAPSTTLTTTTTRPSSAAHTTTRPSSAARTTTTSARSALNPIVTTIKPGSTYTVKNGDTFAKIAKAAYGNEKLWRQIWRANRTEVGSPDDLQTGMKIRIPVK